MQLAAVLWPDKRRASGFPGGIRLSDWHLRYSKATVMGRSRYVCERKACVVCRSPRPANLQQSCFIRFCMQAGGPAVHLRRPLSQNPCQAKKGKDNHSLAA